MANPRDIRFYEELQYHGTTYKGDGSIVFVQVPTFGTNHSAQIGLSCALVSDHTIGLGASGNPLLGKIKTVEADSNCAVQDDGFMTFGYAANDGTAPVVGTGVTVDGVGGVIKATAGLTIPNVCVSVDTVNKIATIQRL